MFAFVGGFILAAPFIIYVAIPFFARPELKFTTSYSYLEVGYRDASLCLCCCLTSNTVCFGGRATLGAIFATNS